MKQVVAVVIILLLLGSTNAQAQLSFGGGPHAGFSFSSFPKAVKDFYGIGIGFGAHGDLNIVKFVTVRLNFDYHIFASDKDKLLPANLVDQFGNPIPKSDLSISGLNAKAFGITANGIGKLPTGSPFTPYAVVGFGIHILNISDGTLTYKPATQSFPIQTGLGSETKFGLDFGAGSEFAIGPKLKLFMDVKYVIIFTSNESTGHIPLTVGATFAIG